MAQPARKPDLDDPPSWDAEAVEREFHYQRARRRARIEHRRELRRARLRFWLVALGLLLLCLVIGVTIWERVQSLFGL